MKYKDYYAILGVDKKADLDAIKKSYRKLAHKYHPDVSKDPQGEAKFKDIAEAYHIPPQLLAKILQRLTKAGLLRSHAGTNGGYALSRPPEDITAFEVIGAIDGPLFITSCETGPHGCDLTDSCTVREPLRKVNESIGSVLKAIRVSDLCEPEHTRKYHGKHVESVLVSLGG